MKKNTVQLDPHHHPNNQTKTYHVNGEKLTITPLGAGQEVGRSAVVLKFKGKTVMFDCGIHPAYTGLASLPFFDEIEPSEIDVILVTHFHLDHCGALPYFTEHTDFQGKVYMTHPTKAIYKLLLSDFVKVSDVHIDDQLFSEQDLMNSLKYIELIDYHQEADYDGIKFWCYNAGHVLGAAMFMVEIAGVKVLYTGDFSRQPDRHLLGAETPTINPDILIVESTYGIQVHEGRRDREIRFTSMVTEIVKRGGRCLLPVFALGRAQELLLILDEYWETHPNLQHVPIYYASSLAQKCMTIFQTYIHMMNDKIRKQFEVQNPFVFKHISNLKSIDDFQDTGPCVIMASPGMLQSGLSRELFEMWCSDPKNGVILSGYCVEGTLAKKIMSEPETVQLSDGRIVPLKMTVRTISFSAHSDRAQTEEFINSIQPPHIVLVHGDHTNCTRLKQSLRSRFTTSRVYAPKNCTTVQITFQIEKRAKVLGQLATQDFQSNQFVEGVVLHNNFQYMLLNENDLKRYTDITSSGVKQNLLIPLNNNENESNYILSFIFSLFQSVEKQDEQNFVIDGSVQLTLYENEETPYASLEWVSNASNDYIVDTICHYALCGPPISTSDQEKSLAQNQKEFVQEMDESKDELQLLYCIQQMLKEHFGNCFVRLNNQKQIEIYDYEKNNRVTVNSAGEIIHCDDPKTRSLLEIVIRRIFMSMFPLPSMMGCLDDCLVHSSHSHH